MHCLLGRLPLHEQFFPELLISLDLTVQHWHAGINGAGKTTQLQIIAGALEADSGSVIKERPNMKIAYLTQEFDVVATRTVRVSSWDPAPPVSRTVVYQPPICACQDRHRFDKLLHTRSSALTGALR